jgi:hypothetical protein
VAEYGLVLLEANKELQLKAATLQVWLETETAELGTERDAFRQSHEHALLELDHWRRRLAHAEDDKTALCASLEASTSAQTAPGSVTRTVALRRTVAQLQEQVDKLETGGRR